MRKNTLAELILKKRVDVPGKRRPISNAIWIEVNPMESDLPDEIVVERALGGKISLVDTSRRPNQRIVTEHVVASFEVDPEPKRLSILRERPKFQVGCRYHPKQKCDWSNLRLEPQREVRNTLKPIALLCKAMDTLNSMRYPTVTIRLAFPASRLSRRKVCRAHRHTISSV